MDNTTYVALSSQVALRHKLDITANNLANISTTGFQREDLDFNELFKKMKTEGQKGTSFVQDVTSLTNFEQGALEQTGGQFDLAIEGKGLFAVQTPDGVRYTRDGRFASNNQGIMVMVSTGYPLLDNGNTPVQLPAGVKQIAVGGDGTISADGQPVSRVGVFEADGLKLNRQGDNLYYPKDGTPPEINLNAKVAQGFIEKSNVNAIVQITQLIDVQHAYENASRLIDSENERVRGFIDMVGRPV